MLYSWQNIKRRLEGIKNPVMAEIGVYQGYLSERLLENIPRLTLYMIDSWASETYLYDKRLHEKFDLQCEKNYELAKKVTDKYFGQAFIIRDSSINAAKHFFHDNFFDLVFIDAGHEYKDVKTDNTIWLPKVKSGGWLCGHDYPNAPGVVQAVDEMFPNAEIDSDFCWFVRV